MYLRINEVNVNTDVHGHLTLTKHYNNYIYIYI